jgi:C1A family cysteine protease
MSKRIYNLNITRIDPRKLKIYKFPELDLENIPRYVDLRSKMPPIYDQGELGSSTANAICGLLGYDNPGFSGSRLFLYYNERLIENNVSVDSGAYIYDGIKSLQKYGICDEVEWPYVISEFANKPPDTCYKNALKHTASEVKHINNDLNSMLSALNNNCPFVVGIAVYESFESDFTAKTGLVKMPKEDEKLLGGHCILVCGYNNRNKLFVCRNSWGTGWGVNGYFYLPYTYLLDSNLSSDLWCIIKLT